MIKQLSQLKEKLSQSDRKWLLLDVDNTLSATRVVYFQTLMQEHSNPEGLTLEELRAKYRQSSRVPYWSDEKAQAIMLKLKDDPAMHANLDILTNAYESIKEINEVLPIAAYLSARPESLAEATQSWVSKHDLPQAEIVLMPNYITNHSAWKSEVLEFLWPEVLGIVDDDLGLITELRPEYKGHLFVYDYAGQEDREGFNIHHCADWTAVAAKIKHILNA
jgi:hypothetical protein